VYLDCHDRLREPEISVAVILGCGGKIKQGDFCLRLTDLQLAAKSAVLEGGEESVDCDAYP
jgi:hypothetical protein